jgi:CHAD domain-containing protein
MKNISNMYCSKIKINLHHNETAFSAIKKILKELLFVMQYNEQGIIDCLDGEFLHDYRVATRKSRSIFTQLKNVYNKNLTKNLNEKFKAIASSTNQLRDLDVFLINRQFYSDLLNKQDNRLLLLLFQELEKNREQAYRNVVKNISSSEYKTFIHELNEFLVNDKKEQKNINSDLEIISVVNKQINQRYNKIVKIGNNIQPSTANKKFHELRIHFKKLRYLVELFSSLYSKNNLLVFIEELKEIQDHLGKINDYTTQHSIVIQYLETLDNEFDNITQYKKMLLDFIKTIDNEQKLEITLFLNTFKNFTKPNNRTLFQSIFSF